MLSKKEAIDLLQDGYVSPRPLNLDVIAADVPTSTGRADFLIDLVWNGKRKGFIAEYKAVATPKKVEAAIRAAKSFAAEIDGRLPMILVPHISKETAERLQEEEVSGIDFSGNIVIIAGEWLVLRTEHPNRFPSNQPLKNVYEGKSSLVGRVLLSQHSYDMVKDVLEEIQLRGASISMGTVSKVLKVLESDLIITKDGGVRLIQPARLLDRLAANYRRPEIRKSLSAKITSEEPFYTALLNNANRAGVQFAGRSETLYVIAPTSVEQTVIYVSRLGEWLNSVPFQETERFSNVEFAEIDDQTAFFDTVEYNGFRWCSKLQIYLELVQGAKRERDAAEQLRKDILNIQST